MDTQKKPYRIGVMLTPVKELDAPFEEVIHKAMKRVEKMIGDSGLQLNIDLFELKESHLTPRAGTYEPLDFLQIALTEKLERRLPFLLVITEVDLSAALYSFVLALPSSLTNVGIVSTRRLDLPRGDDERMPDVVERRLVVLMLHTIGHMLNLPHSPSRDNFMYDFNAVDELDTMTNITPQQVDVVHRNLPNEVRDNVGQRGDMGFVISQLLGNIGSIWGAVRRANPFKLVLQMTTMFTVALSLIIVLFFSAEVWDVASASQYYEIGLFSLVSVLVAVTILYRAFSLRSVAARGRTISESVIVTDAATILIILLSMIAFYVFIFGLMLLGTQTIFPRRLMEAWASFDPATSIHDHIRLAMFLAAMGVLGGSLGGATENKAIIRKILFLDEES